MDLHTAEKIKTLWSEFLIDDFPKYSRMLGNSLPRALLPIPFENLEAGLITMENHYHNHGDQVSVEEIKKLRVPLDAIFIDDDQALEIYAHIFKDADFIKDTKAKLYKFQNEAFEKI